MKWPFTWGDKPLQEIFWSTSEIKEDVDTVMVKGRRVKSAPGLRFSDADGLAVAKRSGWIMSFGKMQDLDLSDVYLDWMSKSGIEPKLNFFTNCLLKLEETRTGGQNKILLTPEQRIQFSQDLCSELIRPTGADAATLCREGYFDLKKLKIIRFRHPL